MAPCLQPPARTQGHAPLAESQSTENYWELDSGVTGNRNVSARQDRIRR